MATLILNAWSGGGKYQPAIRVAAERRGWVIREVGRGADPAGLAASSDTDVLVVAGGDGTATDLLVDVGSVNGRVFINNASIGFDSSMVQDPQYRSRRVAVTSRYL